MRPAPLHGRRKAYSTGTGVRVGVRPPGVGVLLLDRGEINVDNPALRAIWVLCTNSSISVASLSTNSCELLKAKDG